MNTADAFAQRAWKRRVELGLSQTELARRMADRGFPWHQVTVSRTESGERPIRLDEAAALAGILGLPVVFIDADQPTEGLAADLAEATRTIAALRQRVADLERQLGKANARVSHLEGVIAQVKAAVR
ncbi:helix-turn-helix domain-containing protein [Thermomonospora cellulosilytica]|uniref:Transcriptional regulator with XRE-family HTH domain n=1 Tax=Thermomonospora cellulosilytica TaxID=1411118 RepID=A0A7W3MXF9_9ACTN|nr:helix-turn-helix transcriptional regulator [Thermomonospora cellulosilytica]MBA9003695.1 transcriptional regulator with XRE-family HTH domain [Thermomonospora cellulosilytica]